MTVILLPGCRSKPGNMDSGDITQPAGVANGLLLVGKDIITEVIVKPDTLGDPWEVEKVSGYDGMAMYLSIFKNAYSGNLKVYNILTDEPLKPGEMKSLENEINSDYASIGKLQFIEDWYFDPATNSLTKKVKSISFGYEKKREGELPTGYTPLFKIVTE